MERALLKNVKKVVVKVGTSNLTFLNGKVNFSRIEALARVLSDIQNSGKKVILVSSGAIAVGCSKMNRDRRPTTIEGKQAMAAIGQAELVKIYQKFFGDYNQIVAQVLLTKDVVHDKIKGLNARNTLSTLIRMNIIPIINENDTVSTDEIEYGDNDRLSADVARLVGADLLIMLSDIDGLYDADPKKIKMAKIIHKVQEITPEITQMASGSVSSFAKGGMTTKILAAKTCCEGGIHAVIANGKNPEVLFDIMLGKDAGTLFVAPQCDT
jgi:glutamate 5-kinase